MAAEIQPAATQNSMIHAPPPVPISALPPSAGEIKPLIGLPALMRMAASGKGEDLAGLIERAAANANPAHMLMDLSMICQLLGDRNIGLEMQAKAIALQALYRLPGAGGEVGIRLLVITCPGPMMDNTPVEFLLEESDVSLDLLYLGADLPLPPSLTSALPDHDLLFISVCQAEHNRALLDELERLAASWPRPVLNAPDKIARLSRDGVSARLRSIPGLLMPCTARVDRLTLAQLSRGERTMNSIIEGGDFPVLIRPLDSHAGRDLLRLDGAEDLTAYLRTVTTDDFYLSRFVDYRDPDGQYRKYRIVLIGGRAFACHMAISAHWIVHYLNAGMAESAAKRAEEAAFMSGFDEGFARRHDAALQAIAGRFELDYLVVDCAETQDGRLLVFELDNSGFVHALDPVDVFPYKQTQMRKVFAAFRALLSAALERGRSNICLQNDGPL